MILIGRLIMLNESSANWKIMKFQLKFARERGSCVPHGSCVPIDIRIAGATQSGEDLVKAIELASGAGLPQPELLDYNNPRTPFGRFNR